MNLSGVTDYFLAHATLFKAACVADIDMLIGNPIMVDYTERLAFRKRCCRRSAAESLLS